MVQAHPPSPAAAQLPDGIEIFRAGTRTDDAGRTHVITEADVAACAAAYDPAVHEAPLCVGHPADNLPAYGWVASLSTPEPGLLASNHRQVEPQFAELAASGRLKKRSAAFYHPADPSNPTPGTWYLRHVAWLGAQPPAVKGLRDPQFPKFAAGSAFVSFSEPTHPDPTHPDPSTQEEDDMDKDLQAQLDAANKAAADALAAKAAAEKERDAAVQRATQFAEAQRADRHAAHVSFCEAQVKAAKLLPKDKAMAVATLDLLADAAPVEFSEGNTTRKLSPSQWLQELITSATPAVSFGEHAPGGAAQHGTGVRGLSDAELDARAKAYAREKSVSYAEALTALTSFAG